MNDDFDPTLSPFTDADTLPDGAPGTLPAVCAPKAVPLDHEIKKLIVCINKGIRDAQNGHDLNLKEKPQIALSFQKNQILLMRLQLDAIRMNFELQGGKLSQPVSNTTTTNQTLVLTNESRRTLADLLSGQGFLGAPEGTSAVQPLARDGG